MHLWFFFFKQKTAYEMRISDWSSDVCSSDLIGGQHGIDIEPQQQFGRKQHRQRGQAHEARAKRDAGPARAPDRRVIARAEIIRSAERRVGKECVRTCRFRWSRYP